MNEYLKVALKIVAILTPTLAWISVKYGIDIQTLTNVATVVCLGITVFLPSLLPELWKFVQLFLKDKTEAIVEDKTQINKKTDFK